MKKLIWLCVLSGCMVYPDNPAEEFVEEVIKSVTTFDIDLTADDE